MKNFKRKLITTVVVLLSVSSIAWWVFAVHALTPSTEDKLERNRDLRVALREEEKQLKVSCDASSKYIVSKIKTLEAEADLLKAKEGLQ